MFIITIVYFLTFLLMLPLRSLSWLDDFAYIQTVDKFVQTGVLKISDWASATTILPALWGGLFAKIFGFSIPILQVSNIILFYFGLIAFYYTLKNLKFGEFKSVIFSLFLLSYPWIFQLNYSFMTDVFYLSLILISLFFYTRAFQQSKSHFFFFGGLFAGGAFLTRQIAIVIPLALALIFIFQLISGQKIKWQLMFWAFLPMAVIVLFYQLWISTVGVPAAYHVFFYEYTIKGILYNPRSWFFDWFLERPAIYLNSLMNHLLPIFLLFTISFKKIFRKTFPATIFVGLLFILYAFIILRANVKVTEKIPAEIFAFDRLFTKWGWLWPKLIFVAAPVWILTISYAIRKSNFIFLKKIVSKRNKPLFPLKKLLLICFAVLVLIITYFSFINPNKIYTSSYQNDPFLNSPLIKIVDSGLIWLDNLWPAIVLLLALLTLLYLFLNRFQLNIPPLKQPILVFISLILLGHFLLTILFAYSSWEEYTIPWVPLILILLLFLFRNLSLSPYRAVLIIFILLLFSVQITRNRIQEQGTRWELGSKLVQSGVDPYRIQVVSWTWRAYWFFEPMFQKTIAKYNGDKYKVPRTEFGLWRTDILDGDLYFFQELPYPETQVPKELIAKSQPYWVFNGLTLPFIKQEQTIILKTTIKNPR